MNGATTLNILVVGPSKVGKTAISNFLADLHETLEQTEYHPTQGVRILEFEKVIRADSKKNQKWKETSVEVELWDCTGDKKFEILKDINYLLGNSFIRTWSATAKDVHGAVFVTSFDGKTDRELDEWQEALSNLKSNQIVLFAHKSIPGNQKGKSKPSNKVLAKSPLVYTSLDENPEVIKNEFETFLASVYTEYLDLKEKEERAIAK